MGDSPFRDGLFAGARVLVTGGGTGMGLAFATTFAAHGAQVAIASRNNEHLAAGAAAIAKATGAEALTQFGEQIHGSRLTTGPLQSGTSV